MPRLIISGVTRLPNAARAVARLHIRKCCLAKIKRSEVCNPVAWFFGCLRKQRQQDCGYAQYEKPILLFGARLGARSIVGPKRIACNTPNAVVIAMIHYETPLS